MNRQVVSANVQLGWVQFVRAVAVIFVVIAHALHEVRGLFAEQGLAFNEKIFPGDFGVDLFFVTSGFIMVYVSRHAFQAPGATADFVRRRIIRIVPMYWLATALVAGIVLAAPQLMTSTVPDGAHFLSSLFFVPYERLADGLIRPAFSLGWTLQYEMFFYGLFALALFLPRRFALSGLMAALVAIAVSGMVFTPQASALKFWADPVILEFAAGLALGWIYVAGGRLNNVHLAPLVFSGTLLLAVAPYFVPEVEPYRAYYYGLPAILFVTAAVLVRATETCAAPRLAAALGDSSYSTYLSHPFVLGVVTLIWSRAGAGEMLPLAAVPWVFTGVSIVVCVMAGHLTHLIVEKPMTRVLKRKTAGWTRQRVVQSGRTQAA